MSNVSIGKRESTEFKKYVGYFEGEVVAVNPDATKLETLGIKVDEEPEYLKEVDDKEGDEIVGKVKQFSVAFYIRDVKTKALFTARFFLKDKVKLNKDKTKTQYINNQGASSWAVDETGLPKFMTEHGQEIREAHDGEADMYDFIRTWLNQGDFKGNYEIQFDWKDFMKGKIKDVAALINNEATGTIMCPATVRVTDEGKEYQQIFNKGIVAGYVIKSLRLKGGKIDQDFVDQALADKAAKRKITSLQRAVVAIADKEYGSRDSFYLGELKEYDEADNFVASDKVVDSKDASY